MDMQQPIIGAESPLHEHESHGDVPAACGPRAVARLIEYAPDSYFALPPHTTLELIEHPAIIAVPGAAYYTCGMLAWHGQYLPVIDVDILLQAYQETPDLAPPRYALLVAYQRMPRSLLEYGAIALSKLPQTIEVGDEAWCDLPASSDIWPLLAISCLRYDHHIVPIVNTAKLFLSYHG